MIAIALLLATTLAAQSRTADAATTILRTARLIDGAGNVLENHDIVVEGSRITAVRPSAGEATYDLGELTVLPGLIDTHVHIGWHFDASDRLASAASGETPEEEALYAAENAYKMLMAGFTTVQSLGGAVDKPVRDAIARGVLPGPRILTSLGSVNARTGDPEAIRAFIREKVEQGADVIKIFASASIRDGGTPTLSQAQLDAACAEAKAHGLRSVVHAHGPESARRTVMAGCTTIEHGALLDRETMSLMAENGVYFDPNTHLIFQNYFDNKARYLGIGNYTEEGFRQMEAAVPSVLKAFQEGLTIEGLPMVFGTDAVAGAHGRNVEELIYRVETGGQDPHEAILAATSLAAKSLALGDTIGSLRPGMEADLIGVAGNPIDGIEALKRVRFVMKGGQIFSRR